MLNRNTVTARNKCLKAGLRKYYGKKALVLFGKTYSTSALVSSFDLEDELIAQTARAYASWRKLVAMLKKQRVPNAQFRQALRAMVAMEHGIDSEIYTDLGFKPPSRRKPDPATLAVAAVKSRATRAARHTMGSRQRKAIKGTVDTTAGGTGSSNSILNGPAK